MADKEYIERDTLIRHLNDEIKECGDDCMNFRPIAYGTILGLMSARSFANTLPAADVAPVVHAEWVDNHCTACGMMPMGEELWDSCEFAPPKFEFFMDYCPCCGARMDGGKHGQA